MTEAYHMDCMEAMAQMRDNEFDLAIVDPPYGISVNKMQLGSGKYKTDKKWDDNTIEFIPKGKKLAGRYILVRLKKASEKNWLLFKAKQ